LAAFGNEGDDDIVTVNIRYRTGPPRFGSDGDDVLLGGQGLDLLDGGAGDNVLIQD